MGIAGVALGTLLARIFPAGFTLGLMSRKRNLVRIKIFEKFRFDGAPAPDSAEPEINEEETKENEDVQTDV